MVVDDRRLPRVRFVGLAPLTVIITLIARDTLGNLAQIPRGLLNCPCLMGAGNLSGELAQQRNVISKVVQVLLVEASACSGKADGSEDHHPAVGAEQHDDLERIPGQQDEHRVRSSKGQGPRIVCSTSSRDANPRVKTVGQVHRDLVPRRNSNQSQRGVHDGRVPDPGGGVLTRISQYVQATKQKGPAHHDRVAVRQLRGPCLCQNLRCKLRAHSHVEAANGGIISIVLPKPVSDGSIDHLTVARNFLPRSALMVDCAAVAVGAGDRELGQLPCQGSQVARRSPRLVRSNSDWHEAAKGHSQRVECGEEHDADASAEEAATTSQRQRHQRFCVV
mmetsp:Transcript_27293/g.63578  ORF Transcript_27293/g.63578 Transcript_27293/m.63578 type:complete len:334 (-) Transcript_27293:770-1771(-)